MKKVIIISFTIVLILSACEKKLDIDIPEGQKHIVVNGILNDENLIQVNISKSQNILDNENIQFLTDAEPRLYMNDEFVENLINTDSGLYTSSVFPELN